MDEVEVSSKYRENNLNNFLVKFGNWGDIVERNNWSIKNEVVQVDEM